MSTAKRFGARYGRTIKNKFAKVEAMQKIKYNCPSCGYPVSKRLAVGIWYCRKCDSKFTSRAYSVAKIPVIKSKKEEEE
jgi:large subunit ribosomal protein L37Ae